MKAICNQSTNSLIAYKGNKNPVQFYAKGQLIENISAVPNGNILFNEKSVNYLSEYNNNLLQFSLSGNTSQKIVPGNQLFNVNEITGATSRTGTSVNSTYGTISDNVLNLRFGIQGGYSKWLGFSFDFTQASTIYLTCDVFIDESVIVPRIYWNLINETQGGALAAATSIKSATLEKGVWQRTELPPIEIPSDWLGDTIRLAMGGEGNSSQYRNLEIYAKNIMISYGQPLDYEEYVGGVQSPNPQYPQEIKGVTANIKLRDSGSSVARVETGLNLFATENTADQLTFTKKSVNLERHCVYISFKDLLVTVQETDFQLTSTGIFYTGIFNFPKYPIYNGKMYCSHFEVLDFETFPTVASNSFVLYFYQEGNGFKFEIVFPQSSIMQLTVADLVTLINNNELMLMYACEDKEDVTVTDEWAESLKNLPTFAGENEIVIDSETVPIDIEIAYYEWGGKTS